MLIPEDKLVDIAVNVFVEQTGFFCGFSQVFGVLDWIAPERSCLIRPERCPKRLSIRAP